MGLQLISSQAQRMGLPANHTDLLNDTSRSCQIAIDILNTLLTYDKLETGKLQLDFKLVEAKSLIVGVISPFEMLVYWNS